MQVNAAYNVIPRDGCWKGVHAEFVNHQLLCTLVATRCPWITWQCGGGAARCDQRSVWIRLFFPPILTWKSWIAPTWGLVVMEICQRNKKCYVKGQGICLKNYLSSYFAPKNKRTLKRGCCLLLSAVWCEDCSVRLWVRRGWCELQPRKLKIASGKQSILAHTVAHFRDL